MLPRGAHILLVDDEPAIRMTLGNLLQREGHSVMLAASGNEALSLIARRPFHLLLLDLGLPDANGLRVADQAHALQPDMPIIVLTSQCSFDTHSETQLQGISDYILKTSDPQQIPARVARALAREALTHWYGAYDTPLVPVPRESSRDAPA